MFVFLIIYFKIKIVSVFFIIQKYVIFGVIFYDLLTILRGRSPNNWESFCENNGLFTGYSAIYYYKIKISLLFFIFICKIVAMLQIIIGLDLLVISLLKKKIKYYDNGIYIIFVIVPGIYINLIKIGVKSIKIDKRTIKIFILNTLFLNIWLTGKKIVINAIILKNEGDVGKKHEYVSVFGFIRFLRLIQKYKFNNLNIKYRMYFTY